MHLPNLANTFNGDVIEIHQLKPGEKSIFDLRDERVEELTNFINNMTDDIETVIKKCTPEFYTERISAIVENYKKVVNGKSADDIVYENYISKDIGKVSPEKLIKCL